MTLHRFLTERTKLRIGSSVRVLDNEAFHIRKSLRLQPDDIIILFNGEDEFKARLKIVSREVVMAVIVEKLPRRAATTRKFTLFQGLIRASNFELILQKVTELGVTEIVPVFTEFSQIDLPQVQAKLERWRKIVIEACKQSERLSIPEIRVPVEFTTLSSMAADYDQPMLLTLARPQVTDIAPVVSIHELQSKLAAAQNIAYMIGPEGGFSPQEHKLAVDWGIPLVEIGPQILKAETAAIAAQSILNYICS